jgi:putative copper resistance protein D
MWESISLVFRLALYLALSGLVGSAFGLFLSQTSSLKKTLSTHFIKSLKSYFLISLLTLFFTSLGFFWVRVGAFAEEGLAGLFDPLMISILYDSGLGMALNYGLLTCAFAALYYLFINRVLLICMLVSISLSFAFTGHLAELGMIEKGILSLHILIAFLWLGSLYPLWCLVNLERAQTVEELLEKFGYYASFIMPFLLLAGVALVYVITGFQLELLISNWGAILAIKLVLVLAILALAAWHKFKLVPNFQTKNGSEKMASSLKAEIYLGFGILSLSAFLSTLVSP